MAVKKLIVISQSDNYDVGNLVRYLIKMFDDIHIRDLFFKKGFDIVTSNYIKNSLLMTEQSFLQSLENEDTSDYLIFAIHPYGMHISIEYAKKIKKVIWLNDPHYLSYYTERNGQSVQLFSDKFNPPFLSDIDYLVTPSSIYFENLKITKFGDKIIDFFYFLDESLYELTGNINYKERENKIVLSGAIGSGYKSRFDFNQLSYDKKFENLIFKINHPGYEDNQHMTGLNYYNQLTNFKSAFVGHHVFPINFLLAKHIEVLMCGCLGFFEPNPLLKSQIGLIEFKHYIPCFDENGLITDDKFYIDWMESEEGEKIANDGKEYVREKFGKEYIQEFIDFLTQL